MSKEYKIYECSLDIYDAYFYVAFTKSDLKNYLRQIGIPDKHKITQNGLTYSDGRGNLVMYVDIKKKDESDIMNTIAHECFHVLDFVFKARNIKFDNEINSLNEHVAYPLGNMVGQVHRALLTERENK